jgi:ABC-type proline/glycine betaine transport system permease subunit
MKEYILHRCVLMIPTVLGVSLIVFLMMHFIPGDPISILMGDYYTPEAAAAIRAKYGLDRPLHSQYVLWLGRMISGDWGYSIIANRPIFADLMRRFPITIELVILAMGFALLIAIPAGVLASLRPYSWRDYTAMTTALIGVSIPEFFMGVLLILWFALAWRVLPVEFRPIARPGAQSLGLRLLYADRIHRGHRSAHLKEAGYDATHPLVFELMTNNDAPFFADVAALFKSQMAKIGVQVNIVMMDKPAWLDRFLNKYDYQMVVEDFGALVDINQRSVSFFKGVRSNYMGMDSPEIEALTLQWRRTVDPAKRLETSREMQRLFAKDMFWCNISGSPYFQAYRDYVNGYHFMNQVYVYWENTWLEK